MPVRIPHTRLLPVLLAGFLAAGVAADGQAPSGRPASSTAAATDPYAGLTFRNIGPAVMGGRIDDLAVLESNPAVFYVGSATGGLWRTTNNGTTLGGPLRRSGRRRVHRGHRHSTRRCQYGLGRVG